MQKRTALTCYPIAWPPAVRNAENRLARTARTLTAVTSRLARLDGAQEAYWQQYLRLAALRTQLTDRLTDLHIAQQTAVLAWEHQMTRKVARP